MILHGLYWLHSLDGLHKAIGQMANDWRIT